jgi:hypothetical protein
MNRFVRVLLAAASLAIGASSKSVAAEEDRVYSGPQSGERTSPFRVVEMTGAKDSAERDPIAENAGSPTALVFIHTIERSLVPLLRVIDQYGTERKDRLKTEIIFLAADRLAGEQRVKAAAGSLKLQSRVGLSLDGAEGPGNYGLNRECMMTIIAAKENRVVTNFALVQPGIADAPRVLASLAAACDDPNPPSVDELSARARPGPRGQGAMREGVMAERSAGTRPTDLTKFDLNSEAGLRDAVKALISEVQSLRQEIAGLRPNAPRGESAAGEKSREAFPGAVPTDAKLQGLLRSFIRPTNDDATVDRLLGEVTEYIRGNADLTKQAIDGWTRILHFGDHYGTPHAREVGRDFLEKLKADATK